MNGDSRDWPGRRLTIRWSRRMTMVVKMGQVKGTVACAICLDARRMGIWTAVSHGPASATVYTASPDSHLPRCGQGKTVLMLAWAGRSHSTPGGCGWANRRARTDEATQTRTRTQTQTQTSTSTPVMRRRVRVRVQAAGRSDAGASDSALRTRRASMSRGRGAATI